MDLPENHIEELIENYLLGQLKEDELAAFEAKLSTDSALEKQTRDRKEVFDALKMIERKQLSERLDQIGRLKDSESKTIPFRQINKRQRSRRRFYLTAAAAVILFIPSFLLYLNFTKHTRLFNQHFQAYDNVLTFRENSKNPLIDSAMNLYDQREWLNSTLVFEEILTDQPENTDIRFYAGIAYLASRDTEKAEQYLSEVSQSNDRFSGTAKWYLALAYLKDKKIDQAKILLLEIKKSSASYKNNAAELLDRLN